MILLDVLLDPGVSTLAATLLALLTRSQSQKILAEIKAVRQDLAQHVAADEAQFRAIHHALQQTWAAQRR